MGGGWVVGWWVNGGGGGGGGGPDLGLKPRASVLERGLSVMLTPPSSTPPQLAKAKPLSMVWYCPVLGPLCRLDSCFSVGFSATRQRD